MKTICVIRFKNRIKFVFLSLLWLICFIIFICLLIPLGVLWVFGINAFDRCNKLISIFFDYIDEIEVY